MVSCSNKTTKSFSIAFYNVENLFDTIDDPILMMRVICLTAKWHGIRKDIIIN